MGKRNKKMKLQIGLGENGDKEKLFKLTNKRKVSSSKSESKRVFRDFSRGEEYEFLQVLMMKHFKLPLHILRDIKQIGAWIPGMKN